ncbi:protein S100-G-like [Acipenser oxyrinchus oxyrinchus]|uniref:Protein S100-G-like n=1 Tax=Acipenser oxyrinchus oxyrinchus TaxID=40147 RepID=A0AAD8CPI0_ACIOX|nr:protein S100-G-like [Acipenser oxyrinchus oxyrinchus]KAK1154705.1 protein S100-G-like [Acipenser oxyrinchus oxyrinchus]
MTQLELAAKAVAEVFNKYAGQDAEKDMLSKEELKALLQAEIPRLKHISSAHVSRMLIRIDDNKSKSIDLKEFGTLVGYLAKEYKKC